MLNDREIRPAALDLHFVSALYEKYANALRSVRSAQQDLLARCDMRPQLDDIEAEITYLLLRDERPEHVVEIGSRGGWSTSWILHALADNDAGHLLTIDLVADATARVPADLAARRWTFRTGDVRMLIRDWLDDGPDYLFIDADHRRKFGRWYLAEIFPRLGDGITVSVHDVFHRPRPLPFTEGIEVIQALESREVSYFTAAPANAPENFRAIQRLRRELGLAEPIRAGTHNPMIYFRTPASWK